MTSKKKSFKIALTVFILLIGLASNFPFLFMISSSFKVSGEVMKFPWHLIPENPTLMNFEALFIPRYMIFKNLHILDTMWSLILPSCVDVYFVFLLRQSFVSIPDSLSEAAKIDGCGHFRIYWKIIFPLAKPAIATMALFSFTWSWNDYMGPYLYISTMDKQMLSVGVKLFSSGLIQDYGSQMAAATAVLLPILIAFLFCQKFFIEGVASSGVKG